MVSTGRVRWALVGCGWVARDYVIPAMEQSANAELLAVFDRDRMKTEGFRYLELDDLLYGDIDALYIATPNDSHCELTLRAAAAGKHVLCEKPMATRLADAERMTQACRAAGVQYATAFDQRFHGAHLKIRALLARGELGTVTSARIHYACWLPPEWAGDNWRIDPSRAGGGAFIDLAPHGVDLLQFLLDDSFTSMECLKQTRAFDYAVDDGAVAVGKTAGGILASLQVAYNCPDAFPRRTLEIYGTEAMLIARNTMGQTPGGSVEKIGRNGEVTAVPFECYRSPFLNQIEAFSECLLRKSPFPFTAEGDLQTMRVLSSCL